MSIVSKNEIVLKLVAGKKWHTTAGFITAKSVNIAGKTYPLAGTEGKTWPSSLFIVRSLREYCDMRYDVFESIFQPKTHRLSERCKGVLSITLSVTVCKQPSFHIVLYDALVRNIYPPLFSTVYPPFSSSSHLLHFSLPSPSFLFLFFRHSYRHGLQGPPHHARKRQFPRNSVQGNTVLLWVWFLLRTNHLEIQIQAFSDTSYIPECCRIDRSMYQIDILMKDQSNS